MAGFPEQVRPGAGLEVEVAHLNPVRDSLVQGNYRFDREAQAAIDYAYANRGTISSTERNAILNMPANKAFRNGYTSLIIDRAYPQYADLVAGAGMGLYGVHFDKEGESRIESIPLEVLDAMSPGQIVTTIAASNQQTFSHFICQQLRPGTIPAISGDPEADLAYRRSFAAHTALVMQSGRAFQVIPEAAGPESSFITSGIEVARMHVFALPNIISGVAAREGLDLTPDQHRNSFKITTQKVMPHYFVPTLPVVVAVNRELLTPDDPTMTINPDTYTHNGDINELIVFPRPDIIQGVNDGLADAALPPQTTCPAFRSKVAQVGAPNSTIPLPRSLPNVALTQLDAWYYPALTAQYYS